MKRFERFLVLWALAYMAIYCPIFLALGALLAIEMIPPPTEWFFVYVMVPFHLLGMIQNFLALYLTLKDLYLRPFRHTYQKWIWLFLILFTVPIGWIVYIFRYALKPRVQQTPS